MDMTHMSDCPTGPSALFISNCFIPMVKEAVRHTPRGGIERELPLAFPQIWRLFNLVDGDDVFGRQTE
jgi:hypothetical protein